MKYSIVLTCLLLSLKAFSQNSPPVITNLSVARDEPNHQITLTFDLTDSESDDAEVLVKLSDNGGENFLAEILTAQGDVGYPISPGTEKQITFNYNDLLQPDANWIVKVVADDRNAVNIQQLVNRIDSAEIRNSLTFIEGIRHYQTGVTHLEAVKDYIENRLSQHGFHTYRQPFIQSGYDAHNIIGRQGGAKDESVTYIIDAHFDTVDDSPGADDNGSGVAGVLEAARILSQYTFEHSIKFIGFDFEESTPLIGLNGSRKYVTEGIKDYEQLEGVFNFEMIGFYSDEPNTQQIPTGFNLLFPAEYAAVEADSFRGNFVVNTANTQSNDLKTVFHNAAAQYVPGLKVISVALSSNGLIAPDFRRSDHASFWDGGYKALMLTDGANFRNHDYHTPDDVISNLNFTFMSNIVKATVGAVAELARVMNATSKTAFVISTGIRDDYDCEWNLLQSASAIFFSNDSGCDTGDWTVRMFDTQGKMVFKEESLQSREVLIETSPLPKGIYFLSANSGRMKTAKTVVVR